MIGDTGFRMPAVEGIDLSNPEELTDYLGSLGSAIERALQSIRENMNDARYIQVPGANGMESLANALSRISPRPGDVKLFAGTRTDAAGQRNLGWVLMDGTNGTADADNRYYKGPPADTEPNQTEANTIGSTTRCVGVLGCSPAGVDVSGDLNAVTLLALMKL